MQRGCNTDPCGTPVSMLFQEELTPFKTTFHFLIFKFFSQNLKKFQTICIFWFSLCFNFRLSFLLKSIYNFKELLVFCPFWTKDMLKKLSQKMAVPVEKKNKITNTGSFKKMTKLNKVEETLMFSGFFHDIYGTCKLILILCLKLCSFFTYLRGQKKSDNSFLK